jgi:hypothetical protein
MDATGRPPNFTVRGPGPVPTFEVAPGLPAYGPMAVAFPTSGQGAHRQGFVVRFSPRSSGPWVGNFQPGLTRFSGVYPHPDARHVVVISGGEIYVVDPEGKSAQELHGMVNSVTPIPERSALLFDELVRLSLIDSRGLKWRTRRLSWDGIRDLSVAADVVRGAGWRYDETWHQFEVSLDTGDAKGGAYAGCALTIVGQARERLV